MAKGSFSANITDERIINAGLAANEFASDISIDTSGNVAVSSITSGVNISGGTLTTSTSIDQSIVTNGKGNLTKNDVNLSNVDNTSDLNKPVNSNIQTEINTMTGSYFTATANGALLEGDPCVLLTDGTVSGLLGKEQTVANTMNFYGSGAGLGATHSTTLTETAATNKYDYDISYSSHTGKHVVIAFRDNNGDGKVRLYEQVPPGSNPYGPEAYNFKSEYTFESGTASMISVDFDRTYNNGDYHRLAVNWLDGNGIAWIQGLYFKYTGSGTLNTLSIASGDPGKTKIHGDDSNDAAIQGNITSMDMMITTSTTSVGYIVIAYCVNYNPSAGRTAQVKLCGVRLRYGTYTRDHSNPHTISGTNSSGNHVKLCRWTRGSYGTKPRGGICVWNEYSSGLSGSSNRGAFRNFTLNTSAVPSAVSGSNVEHFYTGNIKSIGIAVCENKGITEPAEGVIVFSDYSNNGKVVKFHISGTADHVINFSSVQSTSSRTQKHNTIDCDSGVMQMGSSTANTSQGVGSNTYLMTYSTGSTTYIRSLSCEGSNTFTLGTESYHSGASSHGGEIRFTSTLSGLFVQYLNQGTSGAFTVGRLGKVGNSFLTTNNFVGFSDAAYSNGQTAKILTSGSCPPNQSGLTTGSMYHAVYNGISTTADSVLGDIVIGRAMGPNTLIIT